MIDDDGTRAISERPRRLDIVLTGPIMDRYVDVLTGNGTDGHRWRFVSDADPPTQLEVVRDAQVLIAASMTAAMADSADRLELVQVPGAGFDKIPLERLAPNVIVANTFHHGRSIAEWVLMSAILLSRDVLRADAAFRSGTWRSVLTDDSVPLRPAVRHLTFGLIGLGETGAEIARLVSAFGARTQAVRARPRAALPAGVELDWLGGIDELDHLLATSDVVVVTVPLNDATRSLIGADQYAEMKPTALLINVARGPILDEDATFAALTSGAIGGAALDVWWANPRDHAGARPSRHDFAALPNVLLTPHHAGHTDDTFRQRAQDIAANVAALATGTPLRNVIRPPART